MDSKEKVVKASKILGGVVGGMIGFVVAFWLTSGGQLPFHGNSVERKLEEFARNTNKTLPMQVDEFTRWDRVEVGPGKAYSYIYTVSRDLNEAEKASLRQSVTRKARDLPEMQTTFAAGVTVWYKYYDASGKSLLEFPVKK